MITIEMRGADVMNLYDTVNAFKDLGGVSIGKGPKHPEGNPSLQQKIKQFLGEYPQIGRDDGFVEFLEYYSAASIDKPHEQLTLEIYGFSPDITLDISQADEPLIDEKGFFRFAEILVKPGPHDEKAIGGLYAFDCTGQRRRGIYQKIYLWSSNSETMNFEWYCETFINWLADVVESKGLLPLAIYRRRAE